MRTPPFGALILVSLIACGGRVDPGTPAIDAATTPIDASGDSRPSPLVDSGTTTDGGGAFDTRPMPDAGSPTCADCVGTHCLVEYDACVAQPECKAGVDCIDACTGGVGRTDCINGCIIAAESPTAPKIDDLINCLLAYCADPCDVH